MLDSAELTGGGGVCLLFFCSTSRPRIADLTNLKARFEEDKARVDRFRGSRGGARGTGRGRGRGRSGASASAGDSSGGRRRGGGADSGNRGKAGRSYQPY